MNPINATWKVSSFYLMGITKEYLFRKLKFSSLLTFPRNIFYCGILSNWLGFINVKPTSFTELLAEPLFLMMYFKLEANTYPQNILIGCKLVFQMFQIFYKAMIPLEGK